ncbi:MAG: GDP-mannose 4,6-dehydratase [Acidimicrobiia bacterium]|nr:GDP-mannose 4,6-dehydratase [Acidimicrobiia bacterium]
MKALVTGGAGFIGSHLVDRLVDESDEVLVIDDLSTGHVDHLARALRTGSVKLHQMDVRDPNLLTVMRRFGPDAVYHLAAQASVPVSVADPVADADINVLGTINVLEAAHRSGVTSFVFASSGGAIHGAGSTLPAKESHKPRPDAPYGVAKLAAQYYVELYERVHALSAVTLAPANVYGPRQNATAEGGVVAIFARTLLAGRPATIFGDGTQTRDFVYVTDVVDAFVRAARARRVSGRTFHVATGIETTIKDLHSLMARLLGTTDRPIMADPKPGDIHRSVLDPSAAAAGLDWTAWTPLERGVATTLTSFS